MAEAKKQKLGDMLIDAGLIDDFQLRSALSHQRNWGGKLGTILIDLAFVREDELARVISEKLSIPYVNLFEPEVPEAVFKLIKPDVAKKYVVMPVRQEGKALVLAMLDPLDMEAIDDIRFITGLAIRPALALESEILDAIRKYYDRENVVRKQLQSPLYQRATTGGKMEIIRGSDLNMSKNLAVDESSPILSKADTAQQSLLDTRIRIDSLITLLIEKKLISRDELVSMIYQKKMGL
jgi:MshEN domain